MLRRFGEALQRDRHRGRSKPSVTPTDVGTVGDFERALEEADTPIRLTADLNLAKQYRISSDTEIDLNGHVISGSTNRPLFNVTGGTTVLKGPGSIEARANCGVAQGGGTIQVDGGTYSSSSNSVFDALTDGTVVFNSGEAAGREGAVCAPSGNGHIEINGGTLTGTDNFAVATNGSSGRGGNVITLNGGTLEGNIQSSGYEAIGVYIANNDVFVMNGGTIKANGGTGICMRSGDVTINNGTIIATNVDKNGNVVADGKIGDDPTVMTGCSAVIYHETANYPGKEGMRLTVNGGTITGVDHSIQVLSNEKEPQVFVHNGNFSPTYPEM